eukprot:6931184-Alexandrium_andersonii.AAC.1
MELLALPVREATAPPRTPPKSVSGALRLRHFLGGGAGGSSPPRRGSASSSLKRLQRAASAHSGFVRATAG